MNVRFAGVWGCVILGSLCISGCAHSGFHSKRVSGGNLPPAIAAEYAYAKVATPKVEVTVVESKDEWTAKRVRILAPDEGTNRWIELDYYHPAGKAKAPVVLVLPMSGGGYSIERNFASYFAECGYAAAIVRREKVPKTEQLLETINPLFKRMVLDHMRVIDWLQSQPDIDSGKIGLFGISLGGI